MLEWLFKKRKAVDMDKNANTASTGCGLSQAVLAKVKIRRKFEIFVEEFDEEGGPGHTPIWKPVKVDPTLGGTGGNPVLTVDSQADLQEKMNFYRQLGQRFRIVREIDPPSAEEIRKAAAEQGLVEGEDTQKDAEPSASALLDPAPDTVQTPVSGLSAQKDLQKDPAVGVSQTPAARAARPRIVTIGDMQIKYDGDKVYQKQWMRLTQAEASNFRVVCDANNKVVPMNGRHVEAKRWVLVEDVSEEDDATEAIINA